MSVDVYQGPGASALMRDAAIRELGGVAQPGLNPLGTFAGEPIPGIPYNLAKQRPKIYFVNHSRTRMRQVVKFGVSFRRGARQALAGDKTYKAEFVGPQAIYDEVREGRDMNVYETRIVPATYRFMHNGRWYYIKPAPEDDPENPEPMLVTDDGVWDYFMGNFEHMRSPDRSVREAAQLRLTGTWPSPQKHNPVFRAVYVDGDEHGIEEIDNPFGYIEIRRVIEKEAPQTIDRDFVSAADLVEG
jgi:hypothetical protein